MPTIEDYFDDDTDLPLPSSSTARHLPNTGRHGALIREVDDDGSSEEELDMSTVAEQSRGVFGENVKAPPPSSTGKGKMTMREEPSSPVRQDGGMPDINPNTPMGGFMGDMMKLEKAEQERMEKLRKQFGNTTMAMDPSEYKGWNTVYPLYFDAKRSVQQGRRVPRKDSMWWPQAAQIAKCCRILGLPSVLEPDHCHPADWENPGRVKIRIMKDGRFFNPIVKNRTQLYRQLASQIRQQNPDYAYEPKPKREPKEKKETKVTSTPKPKSKSKATGNARPPPPKLPSRAPLAPQPFPDLESRLPLHSPVHSTGVAVSAVKRDLENEKENKKKGITAEEGGKEKAPKMKRVVVRGPKR
ncbi:hypothetical protein BD324DRAFT_638000 [Kockovaella imperatae]|uniref:Signal recognition particle, SRP19 subunit n=1 Tax=Kockovaella imperatae TaxID=4999 RepID=A0A1Y1U929_9TREE|nr:hypothetical protein BD324DRAFT_638000 [Kockovaella imperatae]ORX34007.1 hypothetical protein BD324DRAFT_638000 [Kockovaella imperatae]